MSTFAEILREANAPVRPDRDAKLCFILRGPSGCGKSYTAVRLCEVYGGHPHTHKFSSDDFWIQEVLAGRREAEGKSDFDAAYWDELEHDTYRAGWSPETVRKAHDWNWRRVRDAFERGLTPVMVDSVFSKAKDMRGYVTLARQHDYKVIIQEPISPWWLDHRHMFEDKRSFGRELEDFARFLAGVHEGMAAKYGARGNRHGVPLDVIRNMIRGYQPNVTVEEILDPSSAAKRH